MVKDFRLELNNRGVYIVPGEVTGTVVVVTDESKSYNAITVTLKGHADVHWSEHHTVTDAHGHQRTVTRHYHSHENYINDVIVLWNADQSPNRALNPGQYVLPFRFALLSGRLPSSFVGTHGHIRYEIEARISTGLFHFDKTVSAIIQVVDRVDINVPALMSPAQFEEEKTICCLCCASRPIILTVTIPRRGFCIGEGIPLTATINNGGSREIVLRATVTKTVTYRAQRNIRTNTQQLNSFQSQPVAGGATFQWSPAEQLAIKSAIPTIANCAIINLQYNLLIEALIPWAIDAVINIPITLGNVPPAAVQQPLPPPQYPILDFNAFVPYNPNSDPAQGATPVPGQVPPVGSHQAPPPEAFQIPPPGAPGAPYQAPPPGAPYQAPPPGAPYQSPPPGAPYQAPPPGSPFQVPPLGTPYQAPPPGAFPGPTF